MFLLIFRVLNEKLNLYLFHICLYLEKGLFAESRIMLNFVLQN